MPTLAGFDGRSFVPDHSQSFRTLRKAFKTPQERAADRDAAAQRGRIGELSQLKLDGINDALRELDGPATDKDIKRIMEKAREPEGGGLVNEASPRQDKRRGRAEERLAIVAPRAAKALQSIRESNNEQEREEFRFEAEEGARNAALIGRQKDFASKQRAIQSLGRDFARKGKPLDRIIELQNMTEPQLDLELQRMKLAGQDIKTILGPKFVDVTDAAGNPVAQRDVNTNRLVSDPRAAAQSGKFSAKTEINEDGSTIQAGPNGQVIVKDPGGNSATGAARLEVLRNARKFKLDLARETSGQKKAGAAAIDRSEQAITSLGKIRTSVANIDKAIEAIDAGANTGAISQFLPSVKTSSIALDNVQKRMGLDVIGTTTFGALSKGELDLALSVAIPKNMKEEALREWLVEKKAAQVKLAGYLENAAIFLGIPGNTSADWIAQQKALRKEGKTSEAAPSIDELVEKFRTK